MPVDLLPLAATMFASAAKLTVVAGLVLAAFALGRLSAQRERSQDHDAQRAMWFARLNDADGGRRRALWSLHRREQTIRALEERLGGPTGGASTEPLEVEPDGGPFAELLRDPVGISERQDVALAAATLPVPAPGDSGGFDPSLDAGVPVDEAHAEAEDNVEDEILAEDGVPAPSDGPVREPVATASDPFADDDATWHLVDDLHLDDASTAEAGRDDGPAAEPLLRPGGDVLSAAELDEVPAPLPAPAAIESTPTTTLLALTPIPPLPPLLTTAAEFDAPSAPAAPARTLTPLPPLPPLPDVSGEDEPTEAEDDEPTHELAAAPRSAVIDRAASDRAANRRISAPLAPL